MNTEKRKFFFEKNEKTTDSNVVVLKNEMKKIIGDSMEDRDPTPGRTYSESTYVRH